MVTGQEQTYSTCSSAALEIAVAADKLNQEGKKTALSVVKGLETQFPLGVSGSIHSAKQPRGILKIEEELAGVLIGPASPG